MEAVASQSDKVGEWVARQLRAGYRSLDAVVVDAAKGARGYRPVPVLGIADRVAYRAITKQILKDAPTYDRTATAYKVFLEGPIDYANEGNPDQTKLFMDFTTDKFQYVVESDIAAFYQYVDHDVLRRELELVSQEIELIDALIELLEVTEGRAFGLPQLLDASDWLSEIYIAKVERDLVRRGFNVWRYNDDFRIACEDYSTVVEAIEALHAAARAVGLTVSDYKTRTWMSWRYILAHTNFGVDSDLEQVDRSDVEAAVTDYSDADDEFDLDRARVALGAITVDEIDDDADVPEGVTNLRRIDREQVREIRRSLAALARAGDATGLPHLLNLFKYVPSLTPRICWYLRAVAVQRPTEVAEVLRGFIEESAHTMSEWQTLWVVNTLRRTSLEMVANGPTWVREQRNRGRRTVLGAECSLALAEGGLTEFGELERDLRTEPEVLAPWFLAGVRALVQRGGSSPTPKQIKALSGSSELTGALLEWRPDAEA